MSDRFRPWLSFRDAALERAYALEDARDTQRAARWLTTFAAVFWCSLAVVDRESAGSPGNLVAITMGRFGFGFPLLALACVSAWSSRYARLRQLALGALSVALVASANVMATLLPDRARFDIDSAPMTVATAYVLIPAVSASLGQRFTTALAVSAVACAHTTLWLARVFPIKAHEGPILFWYVASALGGSLVAWLIERSRRNAWFERHRSEELLHNVLPETIANRLKHDPSRIADRFEDVTVLFGDIAGFTPLSASMSPEALVAALDGVFTAFDEIAHRHGLEKIKTIGDAYMVVGGVPTPREDHAEAIARMAIEMRALIANTEFAGGKRLRMRIGIHSGPVVAGVIGTKKLSYDLWGDTVNTASRMESHGVEGEIHVSDEARARLEKAFVLRDRGTVHVKGKGEMRTWFLEGERSAAPAENAAE